MYASCARSHWGAGRSLRGGARREAAAWLRRAWEVGSELGVGHAQKRRTAQRCQVARRSVRAVPLLGSTALPCRLVPL